MTNVLITGANRGLGLGFVKSFLEKNVNVICTTRNISGSKKLLECKKKHPDNLEILELDLVKENIEKDKIEMDENNKIKNENIILPKDKNRKYYDESIYYSILYFYLLVKLYFHF